MWLRLFFLISEMPLALCAGECDKTMQLNQDVRKVLFPAMMSWLWAMRAKNSVVRQFIPLLCNYTYKMLLIVSFFIRFYVHWMRHDFGPICHCPCQRFVNVTPCSVRLTFSNNSRTRWIYIESTFSALKIFADTLRRHRVSAQLQRIRLGFSTCRRALSVCVIKCNVSALGRTAIKYPSPCNLNANLLESEQRKNGACAWKFATLSKENWRFFLLAAGFLRGSIHAQLMIFVKNSNVLALFASPSVGRINSMRYEWIPCAMAIWRWTLLGNRYYK